MKISGKEKIVMHKFLTNYMDRYQLSMTVSV